MIDRQYREKLYRSYSRTFGGQKAHLPERQWKQYETVYRSLPEDLHATIHDLGCGKGEWVGWLSSKGFANVLGVDLGVDDLAVAGAERGARFVRANLLDYVAQMADASADVIHLKDVVEHLTRDEILAILEHAYRALRPGGQLWVLTFNAQSPLASATRYGDLTHEIGLTPSSMAQTLRAVGFDDISIVGYHYCSPTLRGTMRKVGGWIFYALAGMVLRLRHGAGSAAKEISAHTAKPDIFATARR